MTYGQSFLKHYRGFEKWVNKPSRKTMRWKGKFYSPAEMTSIIREYNSLKPKRKMAKKRKTRKRKSVKLKSKTRQCAASLGRRGGKKTLALGHGIFATVWKKKRKKKKARKRKR